MLIRLYLFGLFSFLLVCSFEDYTNNPRYVKKRTLTAQSFEKIPNKFDLPEYLEALDRLVDFCSGHKNDIDINFYFGLFLANVNLRRAYEKKYQLLPGRIRVAVFKIIRKLEPLIIFFSEMVRKDKHSDESIYKAIFTLFANTSVWMNNLPKFHEQFLYDDQDETNKNLLLQILNTNDFSNENAWVPNPDQSNDCLASLASAKINNIGMTRKCEIFPLCYGILLNGTDFGYALAHRLLLLQLARYGRDCILFSELEDKLLAQRFCSIAYREVQHIAQTDYKLVDILLEHVSLCALDGHFQFLQRSWLANSLRFQTVHGCFSQDLLTALESSDIPVDDTPRLWRIANMMNHDIIGGVCNGHTTGLAASALAMAIRFIVEQY